MSHKEICRGIDYKVGLFNVYVSYSLKLNDRVNEVCRPSYVLLVMKSL